MQLSGGMNNFGHKSTIKSNNYNYLVFVGLFTQTIMIIQEPKINQDRGKYSSGYSQLSQDSLAVHTMQKIKRKNCRINHQTVRSHFFRPTYISIK